MSAVRLGELRRWWCRLVHRGKGNLAYLGGSYYTCRRCLIVFEVPWAKRNG